MTTGPAHLSARDDAPAFDTREFYRLRHANLPNYCLSSALLQDDGGEVEFNAQGGLSSENWQLFYQDGHYFIRNWDYGPLFQLGVKEDAQRTPGLYLSSSSNYQQWTLSRVNEGWALANERLGNGTRYVLAAGGTIPSFKTGFQTNETVWIIENNPSAAAVRPMNDAWLSRVEDVLPSSAISSSAIVSATTALGPATSASFQSLPSAPPRLNAGAIAGIVVGAVLFLVAILFTLYFIYRKKKRPHGNNARDAVAEKDGVSKEAELAISTWEMSCRDGDPLRYRSELDSKVVYAEMDANEVHERRELSGQGLEREEAEEEEEAKKEEADEEEEIVIDKEAARRTT